MSVAHAGADLAALAPLMANRFPDDAARAERFAGIIGDRPSQYAKSPALWNAAFRGLGLNAAFLPFDVDQANLAAVIGTLRRSERLLGCSVTVPYKIRVLELLDEVDRRAESIGAVNTIVRTPDGRLVGYNTDGSGFIAALTTTVVDAPIVTTSLAGVDALLLGGGGAARAVAVYLAERLGSGRLFIANRTAARSSSLAEAVNAAGGHATAVDEDDIARVAPGVALVVNGSTKGQAGPRRLPNGTMTWLEPYSSLAPADSAAVPGDADPDDPQVRWGWFQRSLADIERNNRRSLELAARVPASTSVYDLIYAPVESVSLRHMRYSGHAVANGKGMNIAQAVDAFCDRVCASFLREAGFDAAAARRRVTQEMSRVW